jgi:hypothetical protein
MKKVLLTQSQMKNYSGSEIMTLELAEYFVTQGYKVTILTHFYENPIKEDIEKLGVEVVLTGTEQAGLINIEDYDYLWVHHYTLTPGILEALTNRATKKPVVIFQHMSYQEPLEIPLFASIEESMADLILFNSAETRDELINLYSKPAGKKVMVFDNPAPDIYVRSIDGGKRNKDAIESLAIVSNHPPQEVMEAAEVLKSQGVRVDIYGRGEKAIVKRITPTILQGYDAVVTIGKTVQYSILSDVPAYCYDRFGGPGFLNSTNYDTAHYYNFSGRGFEKKTAQQIAKELTRKSFHKILHDYHELHEMAHRRFVLSEVMSEVFKKASAGKKTIDKNSKKQLETLHFAKYLELLGTTIPLLSRYKSKIEALKESNERLYHDAADSRESLKEKEAALRTINSYKVVRATKLIHKLFRSDRSPF